MGEIGKATLALIALGFGFYALLVIAPAVDRWEREAGYPYGKLCEVYRTCR